MGRGFQFGKVSRGAQYGRWAYCFNEEILRSVRGFGVEGFSLMGGTFTWRGGLNNQTCLGSLPGPPRRRRVEEGPSPFRFENMWLEEEGFKDKMKTWWGSLKFIGTSNYILDAKLRALKNILKIWNKEEFGLTETKKGEALMQVEYWDEKEKYAALNMEECEARNGARESYKSWVMKEEIFWRQKSRELWLKEGDNNTRFFHRIANAHSKRNWLSKLKVNDNSETEGLENPFSEEEVFAALTDLGKDKAPGPDGFTMAFWLFGWDVVKVEVESNQGGVMCKLDIEKAYDHVCWKFLLAMLKKMGFGERWIKWIEWCISTVRYSVLINGSSSRFFQSSRGLRQGDPLSPYLFVIVMEVFSCLMRRAISGGFLSGWRVRGRGGEGILISHLLFANDTLVFCEESQDQLTNLSWLLMWFEACSGLRVNLEKSELIPVGRVNDIEDLALELGCKVGGLPSRYLGLPLGAPFKSKVKSKAEVGEDSEGLPVGGALMNKALLGKWNWRFAIESEALWKQAISHKYGVEEGGWCTRAVSGRHGVGLWKAIRKEWLGMYSSLAYRVDGVGDGWTPLFSRALNDWEIEMVERFMLTIQAFKPGGSALFPYDSIWRAYVPPKVAFFAWEASWGKILTLEQLQRRGYSLANRCFLCLSEAETLRKLSLDGMERLWGKPVKRRDKWPPYVYFGQFGRKEICWLLGMSDRVAMGRALDLPVYFGDAGSREVLHKVGAERACAAAITLDTPGANYRTVWALSKYFPNVKTFVRAHDVDHGLNLEKAGATAVVPETLEPSLQLAAAVLAQAKLPTSEIAATINEFRSRHLSELTELCEASGSSLGYGFSRIASKSKPQPPDSSDENQITEGTLAV
ncbi:K(+) efflux antiporter 2, chloroplastic [Vitis vinifera]|uniref:K(+) efflux antiporter 2, chloroplastic n=1 Tax=Vitis vinifera TaxID=29760 RepID=A0A438CXD9_VITVI|nr:K(+) efflux antiporter 2, chloroplastic [Vitis vinifera]